MIFESQTKRLQGMSCHVMFALMALGASQKPVERDRLRTVPRSGLTALGFFFPSQESQSTVVHNPPDGVKVRSGYLKA